MDVISMNKIIKLLSRQRFMRMPLPLLLLLAIAATAWSTPDYCSGMISHQVPAVVGNNGGLVDVTVSFVPSESGNGSIFAGVYPRLGVSTQESIDQAISYAYDASGKNLSCDVMVSFDSTDTSYIDGPSAGAALSVMTYALLQNRTIRNDTIITGTIEDLGAIGPVGGLYEKSVSAALGGASYFITPSEGIYEMLILKIGRAHV
jgi:uncharacterized protein